MSGPQPLQRLVAEPSAGHGPGAEVLDHHVAYAHQLLEDRPPPGMVYVDGDAVLALVEGVEPTAAVPGVRAGFAVGQVAGAGNHTVGVPGASGLDLDDLGAHVGQQLRGVGPRPDSGEVQYADALEGQGRWSHFSMPLRDGWDRSPRS
jgi:hypothetical protein